MAQKNVSGEQINVIVEFMERHGDISNLLNTPQGRLRRNDLWLQLKNLLAQIGHGPDKSVDQWIKTWTDLKHRIKKKVLQTKSSRRQTGGGPCKIAQLNEIEKRVANIIGVRTVFGGPIEETTVPTPISEAAKRRCPEVNSEEMACEVEAEFTNPFGSRPNDVPVANPNQVEYVISNNHQSHEVPVEGPSQVEYISSNEQSHEVPVEGPSQETLQRLQPRIRRRQNHVKETAFDKAAKMFAEIEVQRLQLEQQRDERQHALELQRLEFERFREANLHEREVARAEIDRNNQTLQRDMQNLLKVALEKLSKP